MDTHIVPAPSVEMPEHLAISALFWEWINRYFRIPSIGHVQIDGRRKQVQAIPKAIATKVFLLSWLWGIFIPPFVFLTTHLGWPEHKNRPKDNNTEAPNESLLRSLSISYKPVQHVTPHLARPIHVPIFEFLLLSVNVDRIRQMVLSHTSE